MFVVCGVVKGRRQKRRRRDDIVFRGSVCVRVNVCERTHQAIESVSMRINCSPPQPLLIDPTCRSERTLLYACLWAPQRIPPNVKHEAAASLPHTASILRRLGPARVPFVRPSAQSLFVVNPLTYVANVRKHRRLPFNLRHRGLDVIEVGDGGLQRPLQLSVDPRERRVARRVRVPQRILPAAKELVHEANLTLKLPVPSEVGGGGGGGGGE